MPTREIGREQWPAFLDEFSRRRAGARVTIEVVNGPQADPRFAARRLPLVGLSYEDKGSGAGRIDIFAGTDADDQITHTITQPVHLYHKDGAGLISDEVNVDEIIEITSSDTPPITFLRFEPEGKNA
jgi:hypothetical protein